MQMRVDSEIQRLLTGAIFGIVEARDVQVRVHDAALWTMLEEVSEHLRIEYRGKAAAERSQIAATRRAYRTLGDDPTRYRPANEALLRRVLSRQVLPQINVVVDINNLVSLASGFALGCYDVAQIAGEIVVRRGADDETYVPIGKPAVDAAKRLVLVDQLGIFGSPTADSQRTMVTPTTNHVLFVIFGFEATREQVSQAQDRVESLLKQFCHGTIIDQHIVAAG